GGTYARYVSTGHLLFARAGTLMAVPFDLDKLEVTGTAVPVVEGVLQSEQGAAAFSVSNTGSLAYVPGRAEERRSDLVWVDRKGSAQRFELPARNYSLPRMSPDGQRLAVIIQGNIWIYDLSRGNLQQVTFEGTNGSVFWTPDSKRLVFQSIKDGRPNLYWKAA